MSSQLEVRQSASIATSDELTIEQMVGQVQKVQQLMKEVMKEDEHYGIIPGTGDKPTLLKPGAEKLCMVFRLDPQYSIESSVESADLVLYTIKCDLHHVRTGERWGSGMGSCNSKEKKYRWTMTPTDLKPSKAEADELKAAGLGGWRQKSGKWVWHKREENDNAYDVQNTILKMACKRALIAACLNATGASDIFTQDLEDVAETPKIELVNGETVEALTAAIKLCAEVDPSIWSESVVLKNASVRFRREIPALTDLTFLEAKQILDGAEAWYLKQQSEADEEKEEVVDYVSVEGEIVEDEAAVGAGAAEGGNG